MKKNFIKYIAALAVAPMLLSSCSDDFLNEIDPNLIFGNICRLSTQRIQRI